MKRNLSTAAVCLSGALVLAGAGYSVLLSPRSAHGQVSTPERYPEKETYRPTPVPDRVVLTFAGDPATSQAVTWRTDTSVSSAQAQITEAGAGPDLTAGARTIHAASQTLTTDLSTAQYHSVRFEMLRPDTVYAYRVGDGANWSEWFQFRTAKSKASPFSFVYFGDAQNDLKSRWSRVIRQSFIQDSGIRFFIHAGDLINTRTRDAEWGEWHGAGGWLNGSVPSIPTPGNHEYGRTMLGKPDLSIHWKPQFTLPENGPESLKETCYYLDYQGARIVSLNSNEDPGIQARWLEKVLSNNPNRWTLLTFHHPILSTAKGRDNAALRTAWKPVFEKYGVDLVMQGHDHTYARSNVVSGEGEIDPKSGTVYVVSVSGPKMYELSRQPWMKRVAEQTQLYQVIRIDGDTLKYEARTAAGVLYDAFELRKRSGAPNRIINQIPETPERMKVSAPEKKG